jgi:hypothetical protein
MSSEPSPRCLSEPNRSNPKPECMSRSVYSTTQAFHAKCGTIGKGRINGNIPLSTTTPQRATTAGFGIGTWESAPHPAVPMSWPNLEVRQAGREDAERKSLGRHGRGMGDVTSAAGDRTPLRARIPSANIANVRLLVCLVFIMALAVVEEAGAVEKAQIQASLNPLDGSGEMIANSETNPRGETWSWKACAQDGSACVPFAKGDVVETGNAAPNTVFFAIASDGPVARSSIWHGNVAAATPPGVRGEVRANALVAPVAGTWSGGWAGDFDSTELAACANPDGSDCTVLTEGLARRPAEATVIDAAFGGCYLRVADRRYGVDTAFAAIALPPEVWASAPTTSVAVVGQIAGAMGPVPPHCRPPPLGTSRPFNPTARLSKRGTATIHCPSACGIVLRAHRGSHRVQMARTLRRAGTVIVRLSPGAIRRLGRGRATVSIDVDGTELAKRTVSLA